MSGRKPSLHKARIIGEFSKYPDEINWVIWKLSENLNGRNDYYSLGREKSLIPSRFLDSRNNSLDDFEITRIWIVVFHGKEVVMKLIRISFFVFLAVNLADFAWAQYGLYGSPDSLRMPEQTQAAQQPAAAQYNNYQGPYAGQTGTSVIRNKRRLTVRRADTSHRKRHGYGRKPRPIQRRITACLRRALWRRLCCSTAGGSAGGDVSRAESGLSNGYCLNSVRRMWRSKRRNRYPPTPAMPQEPMPTLNEMASQQNPGINVRC